MKVFVLDTNKQPLAPCHPARARQLLGKGKAIVYRRYPFTIILKREVKEADAVASEAKQSQPFRLKIDPGSKTTGIAIVNDSSGEVIFAAEVQHRGQQIKGSLDSRRATRRSRRNRKTRYRKPRFNNRRQLEGGLPPSLMSRVYNIETWVARLRRYCPITAISLELVRFDTQAMVNPEISGIEYQQGELFGYEVREYLLEKFGRKCAYCGAENIPLQVEHIIPKTRGGSNRVSNLTIACKECNQRKGNQTAEEFGYPEVQEQAQKPLTDAAAVNATRWQLYRRIITTGLPIEVGTGGQTKYNRSIRELPKTHWLDATCVGASTPEVLKVEGIAPLIIIAAMNEVNRRSGSSGHGSRQICRVNRFGFPRTKPKQFKRV
ncbi:MAG: HNH endonuclease, partial [Deltaproteobacteria bacterium]|nr:HNH endonuclease [Deltaproteobacteria bacterium]